MSKSNALTVERSAIRKVATRLVPFVALMFFINYLDRTAIGFAGPNGMNEDLGLSAAQFGFASGIFFVAYILLEVPSNVLLNKFGARRWLARIMVSWGIVSVLFTWVQNFEQLAVLRFLLGVAEAGFFPGAIFFLSLFVPARHRAKILALFYVAQPLTTVIGAPLASGLIAAHGLFGLEGWRVMFLGVGIPAIVVGVIAWFYLVDKPADAKWLTSAERDWLTQELETEHNAKTEGSGRDPRVRDAFKSGRVWALGLGYFGLVYGFYALAFFLPTIIAGFEEQGGEPLNVVQRGLITAIPYLPAAIALLVWSFYVNRVGIKIWHVALPAAIGGLSIPLALFAGSPVATVAVITVTACAIFMSFPIFWSIPSRFLTGASAAAGIALIGAIGNLAGFVSPYATGALHDATGGYEVPMFVVGGMMLIAALTLVILGRRGIQKSFVDASKRVEPTTVVDA
ncbi:MFS transporter [Microbacterium sp. GXF0217]